MNNVYNFSIRGSRLNCSGYRLQEQSNVDNLNNVRREASRQNKKKKKEYLKAKIDECVTNSENKNIKDLYRSQQ
jgi:hypothetical protein